MTFPSDRNIDITLFAFAGVAGPIVGLAARSMLANIIAGMRIAITETVRINDVAVLEGEGGRVEEISTTNVVVRLWDLRPSGATLPSRLCSANSTQSINMPYPAESFTEW